MNAKWLGTHYGGHWVVLEGLTADSIVYSAGVGEDVTFDLELMRRTGCVVHAFDPTPKSIAWVARQLLPERFSFHAHGLGGVDGLLSLYPPEDPAHVSFGVTPHNVKQTPVRLPVRRLPTVMVELEHDHLDLLKLDIEGSEYAVLNDLLYCRIPVRQVCAEFHGPLSEQAAFVARLTATGVFRVVKQEPPEYTFLHT